MNMNEPERWRSDWIKDGRPTHNCDEELVRVSTAQNGDVCGVCGSLHYAMGHPASGGEMAPWRLDNREAVDRAIAADSGPFREARAAALRAVAEVQPIAEHELGGLLTMLRTYEATRGGGLVCVAVYERARGGASPKPPRERTRVTKKTAKTAKKQA